MDSSRVSESPAPYGLRGVFTKRMTLETFDTWYSSVDNSIHAEWADGEVAYKMNNQDHDGIGVLAITLFTSFVKRKKLGRVYGDHFQIRLPGNRSRREPDLSFVSTERLAIGKNAFVEGPPDLALEIVSPESIKRDTVDKFQEYALGGVREYWLIDPNKETAAAYQLDENGKYKKIAGTQDKIESKVLPGFFVRPEWFWNAQDLDPLELLKEMGVA